MITQIIAYILTVFGVPLLVGTIIWAIPGVLLACTVGRSHDKLESLISAFGEGVCTSIVGLLMFKWLHATPLWVVPIILSVVVVMWNGARKESFLNIPEIAGLISGFAVVMFYL